jgi:hypothetical protein
MYNSYLNIAAFLLTTLLYYLGLRPNLTLDTITNVDKFKKYQINHYIYLGIYLALVIIVQFAVNIYIVSSNCGGNIVDNIAPAALYTFIPWLFIFGVVIITLVIFPGFKSAFSDVIGYFYVSGAANKLLINLLVDQEVEKKMQNSNATTQQKDAMQQAADVILKICGNSSILINQIVPSNFVRYWAILTPLMKPKYRTQEMNKPAPQPSPQPATQSTETTQQSIPVATPVNDTSVPSAPPLPPDSLQKGGADTNETSTDLKNKLFELVVTRDNIGEALWYIYTGILITSIVQLKIASSGCSSNPEVIQQNYQAYLQQQEAAEAQQQQATSTQYTLST